MTMHFQNTKNTKKRKKNVPILTNLSSETTAELCLRTLSSSQDRHDSVSQNAPLSSVLDDKVLVDTHQVELIKQAILKGELKIDAGKIADILLDEVRVLLRSN